MRYLSAYYTDKGRRKGVNQDSLLVSQAKIRRQVAVLAVICDGMGGLERGEAASFEVVRSFAAWFRESFPALAEEEEFEDELYDSWEMLFQSVHRKIKKYGKDHGIRIGTTATAMLLWQERLYVAHVGDCRIYEIEKQIRQLTKDQVKGRLGRDEDTASHILMQGVGVSKTVRPVYHSKDVKENAVYLLCTDGFRHKISIQELEKEFAPKELADENAMARQGEKIAKEVIERGERDNISVILLRTLPAPADCLIGEDSCSGEYIIDKEIIVSDMASIALRQTAKNP